MALGTVDAYGAPQYGLLGLPPAGIVFHTPENADISLASAIAIAKWQATSSNTSGGSYHGILGYDAARGGMDNPDAWVMVRSVPWNLASGGLSTRRDAIWAPGRYPWIQQLITPAAYSDPNKWFHQISLSGKAAWYTANGYPKGLVTRIAEWVRTLETAYKYDAVLTLHRHWQTDRSDPGPIEFADYVLAEYDRLYNSVPAPAPAPEPAPTPAPTPAPVDTKNAALDRILSERLPTLELAVKQMRDSITYTRNLP